MKLFDSDIMFLITFFIQILISQILRFSCLYEAPLSSAFNSGKLCSMVKIFPADFSRIFEFQIPIPEILDFWDFALGIFPGFFDQDRNKKIGIPKKSHPEQALVDITKSLVAVIVINTEFDKDEMFENKFAVTF